MNWATYFDNLISNIIKLTNPTWQQLALLLGFYFLIRFGKNIAAFIDRIKKIGKDGITCMDQKPVPEDLLKEKVEHKNPPSDDIKSITSNVMHLEKYLKTHNLGEKESLNFLIRETAEFAFVVRCERVYNLIFRSQIELLRKLNASTKVSLTQIEIDDYFTKVAAMYSKEFNGWNSGMYMNFLIQSQLVTYRNNIYIISDFGGDFLYWMVRMGFTENTKSL